MVSALTGRAVREALAMTGEITLSGRVLPIGGLKEKALAARRAGIKTILVPRANERDLEDVPAVVRQDIQIKLVSTLDQVLKLALEAKPMSSARRKAFEANAPEVVTWSEARLPH
jgi:ATP-dependent Lon protease